MTMLQEENLKIYGTIDITPIPQHIVKQRIDALEDKLEKLMSVHFMKQDNTDINYTLKTIKFWKKLGNLN